MEAKAAQLGSRVCPRSEQLEQGTALTWARSSRSGPDLVQIWVSYLVQTWGRSAFRADQGLGQVEAGDLLHLLRPGAGEMPYQVIS